MRHKGKPWQEAESLLQMTLRYQNLSVRELARLAKVPPSTAAKVVAGEFPRLDTALRLARVLKVSVEDLWGQQVT